MIAYWVLGLVVFLWFCAYAMPTKRRLFRLILLPLLAILFLAIAYVAREPITLGDLHWYNVTPWREICFFLAMILGMIANPVVKAIKDQREENRKLKKRGVPLKKITFSLDLSDFWLPIFFFIPTFGSLWSQLGDKGLSPVTLAVAFETGFFWDNILRRH